MKKIILVNLLVVIFLLVFIEFLSVLFVINERLKQLNESSLLKRYKNNIVEYVVNCYTNKWNYGYYDLEEENFRPIAGNGFKRRPIILFGCSVTYGNLLDSENNFSGILSRISKRPVYNMAYDGWGPAHMLKLLKENRNKNLFFIKNPEYVVYTIIKDHKKRLVFYQGWGYFSNLYFRYLIGKDEKLYPIPRKYPAYWRFFTTKHIQHAIEKIRIKN